MNGERRNESARIMEHSPTCNGDTIISEKVQPRPYRMPEPQCSSFLACQPQLAAGGVDVRSFAFSDCGRDTE